MVAVNFKNRIKFCVPFAYSKSCLLLFPGIYFNVTLGKKLLQIGVGLPEAFQNQTEGLLGNFNNNPDDDFIPRYSDKSLPYNSTERTIFEEFGQTCKSLFY